MKIVKKNQLEIVIFTAVKNRYILHGRVFVMQGFRALSCLGQRRVKGGPLFLPPFTLDTQWTFFSLGPEWDENLRCSSPQRNTIIT